MNLVKYSHCVMISQVRVRLYEIIVHVNGVEDSTYGNCRVQYSQYHPASDTWHQKIWHSNVTLKVHSWYSLFFYVALLYRTPLSTGHSGRAIAADAISRVPIQRRCCLLPRHHTPHTCTYTMVCPVTVISEICTSSGLDLEVARLSTCIPITSANMFWIGLGIIEY